MRDIVFSTALVVVGGFAFIRGLRPFLLEERYTAIPLIQLVGGLVTTAGAMFWLLDAVVTMIAQFE
jgi:hypothetical protein